AGDRESARDGASGTEQTGSRNRGLAEARDHGAGRRGGKLSEPARQRETLDGDAVTAKPRAQRLDGGHDAMPDRAVADAELARELTVRAPFQEVRDQCGALRLRQGRDRRVDAALELAPEDEDIGCGSDRRLSR